MPGVSDILKQTNVCALQRWMSGAGVWCAWEARSPAAGAYGQQEHATLCTEGHLGLPADCLAPAPAEACLLLSQTKQPRMWAAPRAPQVQGHLDLPADPVASHERQLCQLWRL